MFWPLPIFVVVLLAALTLCFAIFALQTWRRQLTSLWAGADNLKCVLGLAGHRQFAWRDLRAMSLAYFSVRGDGRSGWMELKLNFSSGTVRVDSRLDGFDDLVRISLGEANRLNITLSPTTCRNLAEMGLAVALEEQQMNVSAAHD